MEEITSNSYLTPSHPYTKSSFIDGINMKRVFDYNFRHNSGFDGYGWGNTLTGIRFNKNEDFLITHENIVYDSSGNETFVQLQNKNGSKIRGGNTIEYRFNQMFYCYRQSLNRHYSIQTPDSPSEEAFILPRAVIVESNINGGEHEKHLLIYLPDFTDNKYLIERRLNSSSEYEMVAALSSDNKHIRTLNSLNDDVRPVWIDQTNYTSSNNNYYYRVSEVHVEDGQIVYDKIGHDIKPLCGDYSTNSEIYPIKITNSNIELGMVNSTLKNENYVIHISQKNGVYPYNVSYSFEGNEVDKTSIIINKDLPEPLENKETYISYHRLIHRFATENSKSLGRKSIVDNYNGTVDQFNGEIFNPVTGEVLFIVHAPVITVNVPYTRS